MVKQTIYVTLALATMTGCVDFDDAVNPLQVEVSLVMPEGYSGEASGHRITLTSGSVTTSAMTDAAGVATFDNLAPDVYDVSCNWTERSAFSKLTMAGSISSALITQSGRWSLDINSVEASALLISKIYYAGGKDNNGKNYDAGRFIELYNNTDEEVELAGLYIGLTETGSDMAYTLEQAPDTIFLKQIFRFPANVGLQSVAPGSTVLVTNSAIDHTVNGPNEYDLTNADFECEDIQGKYIQNPATPKLELIYTSYESLCSMNFVNSGPSGFVLFSTDEDIDTWPRVYAYQKQIGSRYVPLPIGLVLDGVEVLKYKAQTGPDYSAKRLYDSIDAGGTWVNAASGRNGEVVCRVVSAVANDGRVELQDTNNSTNDFVTCQTSAPGVYE